VNRWYPKEPHWWFRWWMYPPTHRRRLIGVGQTWEYRLYFWAYDWKVRLTPGQCTRCGQKKGRHRMRCPKFIEAQIVYPWDRRG
jgi:hypothetical protein